MDYRDKLKPSPWDTFAPPRRYIFTPPLTPCRLLEGVCTLSKPFTRLDREICGILPGQLGGAAGACAGGAITPQTRQLAAAGLLQADLGRRLQRTEMDCPRRYPIHGRRVEVSGCTLLRRFLGARSDHGGQQQSAGAGRRTGRTGIPLVGSRGSRTRIPEFRRERATDLTACLRPTLAYQHTRNTRTACCRPCLVRQEARVEPMGLPARCIGRIPGEAGTRSRS